MPMARRTRSRTLRLGIKWTVIGNHNYGEGSSREHAALEPRYLGPTSFKFLPGAKLSKPSMSIRPPPHEDGSKDEIELAHSFSEGQIEWLKAGSALNLMAKKAKGN
ncbi:hypothetical protein OPQ81_002270 [Rhizoctonia solani]|nr:hypothetical protein OPQ81_002270 [Rhizoctonia solani]